MVSTITDFRTGVASTSNSALTATYKSDIWAAAEYYPFGMASRAINSGYRFGFNGKENDNDIKGGFGLQQDYGMRIYDPRVGRFLSVDPIDKIYPELTPYQFSSNRPIDGVDLDGQEYIRRVHTVDADKNVISTYDIPYYQMRKQHLVALGGTPPSSMNAAGYGPEGKGVKHEYLFTDGTVARDPVWDARQNDLNGKISYHGLFSGPGSVTYDGINTEKYDFRWTTIDAADAIAKRHDMNYENSAPTNYQGFIEDTRTLDADIQMVKEVKAFLAISGTPLLRPTNAPMPSAETLVAAGSQLVMISTLAAYKTWKIQQMENINLDKNNPEHMKLITLDDYKVGWLKALFNPNAAAQKANYEFLKASETK